MRNHRDGKRKLGHMELSAVWNGNQITLTTSFRQLFTGQRMRMETKAPEGQSENIAQFRHYFLREMRMRIVNVYG